LESRRTGVKHSLEIEVWTTYEDVVDEKEDEKEESDGDGHQRYQLVCVDLEALSPVELLDLDPFGDFRDDAPAGLLLDKAGFLAVKIYKISTLED
jgi:hypothetical protein